MDWKRAAGLILLAGVLSLMATQGRSDGGPGRNLSPGPQAASAGQDEVGLVRADHGTKADRVSSAFVSFPPIAQMDSMMQAHPWPTLFWGVGAGYLLARRMR